MRPPDAITGWNDEHNAELYDQFTRGFPFYTETSRDLIARADLGHRRVVVDLCGGTGVTADLALDALPADGHVTTVDNAPAMHTAGRRTRTDPRISWILANAEELATADTGPVDAVVCNAAIWKTHTPSTFAAVRHILRPGGRFVFNVGGGFAGLPKTRQPSRDNPSLTDLITAIAIRDYGYQPAPTTGDRPILTEDVLRRQLRDAGLNVLTTEVVTHHGTLAEKRAWLSIPLFARPSGILDHRQRLAILDRAYREADKSRPTTTAWLIVAAEAARGSGS